MTVYDLKTMQICEIQGETAVALGTFDGCHIGHASVLRNAFYKAKELGIKSLAYTFDTSLVKGQEMILTLEEKIKEIAKLGIDLLAIESFENVKDLSGHEFVLRVLQGELNASFAVCGFNYRFGKGASCSAEDLVELFEKIGGSVQISPKVEYNGVPVSSTLIRQKIKSGELEDILGYMRPYSIYAPVQKGKGMGARLGFATINQVIPAGKVIPATGVYVTECEIGEDVYPSVTNIGYRPTTDGENSFLNVETHIIGFNGDLYLSAIRVNIYKRLRDEKRFDDISQLMAQVEKDKMAAISYFK